jgi:hypothetical protein
MAKHESNVYTVMLLAAFLSLAVVSVVVFKKLTDDYKLTPTQIFSLDKIDLPGQKAEQAGKPAGGA